MGKRIALAAGALALLAAVTGIALSLRSTPPPAPARTPSEPTAEALQTEVPPRALTQPPSSRSPVGTPGVGRSVDADVQMLRVTGHVLTDTTGTPVPAGWVKLEFDNSATPGHRSCVIRDGAFSAELPRGAVLRRAFVEPPEDTRGMGSDRIYMYAVGGFLRTTVPLDATPLEHDRVLELRVDSGVTYSGVVTDEDSGAGIAEALIVVSAWGLRRWAARSTSNGKFSISGIDPAQLGPERGPLRGTLIVTHPRYRTLEFLAVTTQRETDALDLRLRLSSGISVVGRVIDSSGLGRSGVDLQLRSYAGPSPLGNDILEWRRTRSGEQGGFAFVGVRPAARGELSMPPMSGDNRWVFRPVHGLNLTTDVSGLLVRLEERMRATYRVEGVLPDGTLVSGEELSVIVEDDTPRRRLCPRTGPTYREFTGVLGGSFLITAAADGPPDGSPGGYRGEALASGIDRGPHVVRIALMPFEPPPRPPGLERRYGFDFGTLGPLNRSLLDHEYLVNLVDVNTGEALQGWGMLHIRLARRTSMGSSVDLGRNHRLILAPMATLLQFDAPGYRPRYLELDPPPGGYSELEVALEPIP